LVAEAEEFPIVSKVCQEKNKEGGNTGPNSQLGVVQVSYMGGRKKKQGALLGGLLMLLGGDNSAKAHSKTKKL